jgi:hypothetical protein
MKHTIWACPVTHQQADSDWPFCSCCSPRQENVSFPAVLKTVSDELAAKVEAIIERGEGTPLHVPS